MTGTTSTTKYTFSIESEPKPNNGEIWVQLSDDKNSSDKVQLTEKNISVEFCGTPTQLIIERKVSLPSRLIRRFYCKYVEAERENGTILYFPIFRNLPAGKTTISEKSAKVYIQRIAVEVAQSPMMRELLQQSSPAKGEEQTVLGSLKKYVQMFIVLIKALVHFNEEKYEDKEKDGKTMGIKHPGYVPACVEAESWLDLPTHLWFRAEKVLTMAQQFVCVGIYTITRRLHNLGRKWTKLNDIKRVLLHTTKKAKYISENWEKDSFFAKQFLIGCNPVMIEKCKEVPKKLPIDKLEQICPTIQQDIQNGIVYMVDYKLLDDVDEGVHDGRQQYVAAPIVLLRQTEEEGLMPIAIQLKQNPGKYNPVFTPADKDAWLLAKIWVRNSEFYVHELVSHLLRTHLLGEVFSFSFNNEMPEDHAILMLFKAWGRYNIPINIEARSKLLNDTGFFVMNTGLSMKGVEKVLRDAYKETTYEHLCLPDNLKLRGVEDLKGYHYRDDAMEIWEAIEEFVHKVIYKKYESDEDLVGDKKVQKFCSAVYEDGFRSTIKGLPSELQTRDEAVKYLTMVMFTCSAQHAAVNNSQSDFYAWMPNGPITMRQPPPEKKTWVTESYIMDTLPDISITLKGMFVAAFLSQVSTDFEPLGQYSQVISNEPCLKEPIKEFQERLKKIGENIDKRDECDEFHYDYIHPTHMENSIAI